jgi:hypothetical protein
MHPVRGFFRFWWDFIVGDDWRIAAGVSVVLAIGALLVSQTNVSDDVIVLVSGSGILLVAIVSILSSALRLRRNQQR